jgi:hypothetical protein
MVCVYSEIALAAEAALKADYERFVLEQPATLTAEEREAIRRLAMDIPALWRAPTTSAADRQAIIRQLVERIIVTVQGEAEQVDIQVHWVGGHGTRATLLRPVVRLEQLSYSPHLRERIAALHAQGYESAAIARAVNAEGWRPAKRCGTFNAGMIRSLLARQGRRTPQRCCSDDVPREADEWTLAELAHALDMPQATLYTWLRQGQLKARQDTGLGHPIWLVHADGAELARLRSKRTVAQTGPWPEATD